MTSLDSRILVTGARGFIGRVIFKKLYNKGFTNLVKFRSNEYDLTKEIDVQKLFIDKGPFDIVIHAAADVGGYRYFRDNPGRSFYNNTMMNTLLMEHSRINKVKKFIGLGSVLEYPKNTEIPLKEENLNKGRLNEATSCYGITKLLLLEQGLAFSRQYGFIALHLILTNTYGSSFKIDHTEPQVIPALIKRIHQSKIEGERSIEIRSALATREFLYVDDCAEAIILAMEEYNSPDPVNIGSGQETKIGDLAMKIAHLIGFEGEVKLDKSWPEGKLRSVSDISKAEDRFGFKVNTSIDEGLRKTVDWYMEIIKD